MTMGEGRTAELGMLQFLLMFHSPSQTAPKQTSMAAKRQKQEVTQTQHYHSVCKNGYDTHNETNLWSYSGSSCAVKIGGTLLVTFAVFEICIRGAKWKPPRHCCHKKYKRVASCHATDVSMGLQLQCKIFWGRERRKWANLKWVESHLSVGEWERLSPF